MGLARALLITVAAVAALFIAYLIGVGAGYRAADRDRQEHMRAVYEREHAEATTQP